jgi:WD40 repeat protein
MFVGYTDTVVKAWDTTSTAHANPAFTLSEHTGNVTSVGLNSTGNALCTGSADRTIKVVSLPTALLLTRH